VSYTDLNHVLNMVPKLGITSSSSVNTSMTQQYINQVSDEIDAALESRGIQTPVASPAWFVDELSRLNADGAVSYVLQAAFPTAQGSASPAALSQQRYQKRLSEIRQGVGLPVNESYAANATGVRSYWTDNPPAESGSTAWAADDTGPAFTRRMEF
jgi:hypothetical protein